MEQTSSSRSLSARAAAVLGEVVGDVADQARRVGLAQQGRDLAHQDRAGAERLDHQAQRGQFLGAGDDALGLGGVQLDHLGQQQGLAGHAAVAELALHALVDQALVGGVLVDDDHAVAGLGDDVGLVHLGAGRAEREVDRVDRRRGGSATPRRRRSARAETSRGPGSTGKARGGAARAAGAPGARSRPADAAARPVRRAPGRKPPQRRARHGGRGAVAGGGQRMAQAADDQAAHQAGSRNRTSALAGWTLTSTCAASSST